MNIINPESVGLNSAGLAKLDALTNSLINQGEVAGTTTFVARQGRVAHFSCQGKMSVESGTDMQPDTIFRIYSMTKPVTALCIMMLIEKGLLTLNTPIADLIPAFKEVRVYAGGSAQDYQTVKPLHEITIFHLLTHTSGLTYDFLFTTVVDELYRLNGITALASNLNMEEFVKRIAGLPLLFQPGTQYNYSVATDILGYIVQIVSGKPLDVFFQENVFKPLGMHDTGFSVPKEKLTRFATNYIDRSFVDPRVAAEHPNKKLFLFDDPANSPFANAPNLLSGGGGLVSTVNDYYQFASMLLNKGRAGGHQLVKPETIALMTSNHLPCELDDYRYRPSNSADNPGTGIGFGFSVTTDTRKSITPGSEGDFGWSGAANTYFLVDPKQQLIAMYFMQLFPFDVSIQKYRHFKTAVYQSLV